MSVTPNNSNPHVATIAEFSEKSRSDQSPIIFDPQGARCGWNWCALVFSDVGIKDDRIATIGKIGPGSTENMIESDGRFLVPGFVDVHVHTDLEEPNLPAAVFQGITSHVIGQD